MLAAFKVTFERALQGQLPVGLAARAIGALAGRAQERVPAMRRKVGRMHESHAKDSMDMRQQIEELTEAVRGLTHGGAGSLRIGAGSPSAGSSGALRALAAARRRKRPSCSKLSAPPHEEGKNGVGQPLSGVVCRRCRLLRVGMSLTSTGVIQQMLPRQPQRSTYKGSEAYHQVRGRRHGG